MTDEATTPPGDAVHAARPMRSQGAKLGETAQVRRVRREIDFIQRRQAFRKVCDDLDAEIAADAVRTEDFGQDKVLRLRRCGT